MGRRSHSQTLALWVNGARVGRWTITGRGEMELQYDPGWVNSPFGRPLSLSLPFPFNNESLKGDKVAHYFEGLLPDSDAIRRRVAARFRMGSTDAFDLLAAIGRRVAGQYGCRVIGDASLQVTIHPLCFGGAQGKEGLAVDVRACIWLPVRGCVDLFMRFERGLRNGLARARRAMSAIGD